MNWSLVFQIVGYISSALVFSAFYMKTMIPLRVVAICSNITFITYAILGKLYPILILHSILLPLNFFRLYQMKKLIKKVKEASHGGSSMDYLIPYMSYEKKAAGETLFQKGDRADKMFIIKNGNIVLPEVQKEIGKNSVLGEVGLFSPNNARACSAVCATECEIFSITADKVMQLYYQNPAFGFLLIRSIATIASGAGTWKSGHIVSFEEYLKSSGVNTPKPDITGNKTVENIMAVVPDKLVVRHENDGMYLKGDLIWDNMIPYDDILKVVIGDGKLRFIDVTEVNNIDSSGTGMLIKAFHYNNRMIIKNKNIETVIESDKNILQIAASIINSK